MKNYEKIVELGCFSIKNLCDKLGCCISTAATIIQKYLKNGYIERVRRDLYVALSIETKQPVCSRYQIGATVSEDACISHHSAFEVYGYANQVFYETYIMTNNRFRDFDYNGIFYHRLANKDGIQTEYINHIRVTAIEQTVVDSIEAMEKIGGLEETIRCIVLIPTLNYKKLLEALKVYNNGFLYQKCGYILESLNQQFLLPDDFFDACSKHISKAKRYLTKDIDNYVWHSKWKLYAPSDVQSIIDKGMNNDYEI